jgi:hypothetical protein
LLLGTALAGAVVYLPLVIVYGLTDGEKRALRGFAKRRPADATA